MARTFIKLTSKRDGEPAIWLDAARIEAVGTGPSGTRVSLSYAYAEVVESPDEVLGAIGLNDDVQIAARPETETKAPTREEFEALMGDLEDFKQQVIERADDMLNLLGAMKEDCA